MRYEAKHSYFKRLAAYMGNFTNVAFTLADRHQTHNCYVTRSSIGEVNKDLFHSRNTIVGSAQQVVSGDATYFNDLKVRERDLLPTDIIYESKKVFIYGTEYRFVAVVHVGWMNELPEFASIFKIVVLSSSKTYFVLKKYVTIEFSFHFHAFEVRKPTNDSILVLQQSEFKLYIPAHATKLPNTVNGAFYVAPRCNVPES